MTDEAMTLGDYVGATIEGRVVATREDETGKRLKVEFFDNHGELRQRWLYSSELEIVEPEDRGGGAPAAPAVHATFH